MQFRFNVQPEALYQFFSRWQEGITVNREGPMQTAAMDASEAFWSAMRTRFSLASHRDGTWEPLANRTIQNRRSKGQEEPLDILHEYGDLEFSLHRGYATHVLDVQENAIVEGTADEKARYHQDGTAIMPARTIAVLPDNETLDVMRERLAAGVRLVADEARNG